MGLLDGLITSMTRSSKFGRSHSLRPLTPKRANRRFYKGNGCRNEGVHAKRGRYVVDPEKLLQLQVPDLTGFKVRRSCNVYASMCMCMSEYGRLTWYLSLYCS